MLRWATWLLPGLLVALRHIEQTRVRRIAKAGIASEARRRSVLTGMLTGFATEARRRSLLGTTHLLAYFLTYFLTYLLTYLLTAPLAV